MDFNSLSGSSSLSDSCHGRVSDCYYSVSSEENLGYYEESTTPTNDSGYDMHDENTDDISHQSQCSLIDNFNCKSDSFHLKLGIKVDYHNENDSLLKHYRKLEFELSTAKEQLQRLLRNSNSETRNNIFRIKDNNNLELEKKYYEIKSYNSTLQLNLSHIKDEKNEIEDHNKHLQIERGHCLIELKTKNAVITELKQKISNQFVQIQELTQSCNEKTLQLNQLNCELQQAKKCHDWFKLKLRYCQKDKKSLMTELASLKSEIILQQEEVSLLNIVEKNIKIQLEALQFETSTNIETNIQNECERCRDGLDHVSKQTETIQDNNEQYLTLYNESLNELRNEILQLKALMALKDDMFHKISAENATAVSQCITLQKKLQETRQAMDHLENENSNLKTEIELQENRAEIHRKTQTELVSLKTVLLKNQKEQEHVEILVNLIRKQLSLFEMKFNSMHRDIANKNKQILELQQDIQKLYMEKNWQICELKKIKENEKLISELKNEIQKYIRRIESMESQQQKMHSQYSDLYNEKNELSSENLQQIQRYEMALQQYKDLLLNSEVKFNELKKSYTNITKSVYDNNVAMDKLMIELDQKNSIISEFNYMCEKSEDGFKNDEKHSKISKNTKEGISDSEQDSETDNGDKDREIEKLKVLLKVKDLDTTEKQKKFEANISTLLRKVREQILEKKVIKKQYANELNCLKLSYETIKREKETVESIVFTLQQELNDASLCNKCSECEIQEKQVEEWKSKYNKLKEENQDLDSINSALKTDRGNCKNKCDVLLTEKMNSSEHSNSQQLDDAVGNESSGAALFENKNELISNEKFKILNIWETLIEMQNELQSVNSEKFFLQRLNNDLKFALRKQVNYNKILKEEVLKQSLLSLPIVPTHVQKYDENHINRILQRSKASLGKEKFSEIHCCLDSMKNNIKAIQEDIVKNRK